MVQLLIYGIGLTLLFLFFVYIILPIGSILLLIGICIGLVIGLFSALKCYFKSIKKNINPYDYYIDRSLHKQEYASRKSYFFGPGYSQLIKIAKDAWIDIWDSTQSFSKIRDKIVGILDVVVIRHIFWITGWIFYICAVLSVGVLGSFVMCVLGLAHAIILASVMAVIYILFSVTWVIDRIYLQARDTICREFLMDIGLKEAVQAIEAGFIEVHYFPVSAMGHAENGDEYEPEHVTEPFYWLIGRAQPELMKAMGLSK